MKINFEKVSIKSVFRWKEGSKRYQRTKTFCQTINPFNRNADGSVKTREKIMLELTKQRDDWLAASKEGDAA